MDSISVVIINKSKMPLNSHPRVLAAVWVSRNMSSSSFAHGHVNNWSFKLPDSINRCSIGSVEVGIVWDMNIGRNIVMAMWKIWNCQTLHKSLEITNALTAVHVTSQTLYTEIANAVHVTSLPGSLYVCLHFANAHEEHGAVSSTGPYS